MPKNIIEKIWDSHVVHQSKGHPVIFSIDKMLMHEVTSAQAFDELRRRKLKVKYPQKIIATLDHSIPTREDRENINDAIARHQVETLRKDAKEFNVRLYDFESQSQGIVHVMGPELGFTLPGETIVCGDSHTSTHGAFGTLAFGVGTSEVGHVLATGCILQEKPKTMKVKFKGKLKPNVSSKDVIMKLIASIGIGGGTGHVIEYVGECIREMSMEARMTLCNMSIECGARGGLISPDQKTFDYLAHRRFAPKQFEKAIDQWIHLKSDPNCHYDKRISIDVDDLNPMISWGINPSQTISIDQNIPLISDLPDSHHYQARQAYAYTQLKPGQKIKGQTFEWAFVGSCTNGRIEDFRVVAKILENKKVADHVTMYIVPGSEKVLAQIHAEKLSDIFEKSGAKLRMPGCSMCLAMNDDKVPEGARCVSTSNRNFIGRQGPGSITHIASPATVAASAVAGFITSVEVN